MIAEKATECIEQAVCHELRNIVKKYGPTYHSEHEGFAVLKEEVEEVEECVQQSFLLILPLFLQFVLLLEKMMMMI